VVQFIILIIIFQVETAELMDFTSFAAALKLTGVDKVIESM